MSKWQRFTRFFVLRATDWWAAVSVRLLAWLAALWAGYGFFAFARDEWASQYWRDRLTLGVLLPGVSARVWVEVLLVILFVVSVEGIHRVSQQNRKNRADADERLHLETTMLHSQIAALRAATPKPVLRFYIEGKRAFLEVYNEGAQGVFHLLIERAEMVPDWPTKDVSGRWDHEHRTHAIPIVKKFRNRLRIAEQMEIGWNVIFTTDFSQHVRPALQGAILTVALLAVPDLEDGPIRRRLWLNQDGSVAMTNPD